MQWGDHVALKIGGHRGQSFQKCVLGRFEISNLWPREMTIGTQVTDWAVQVTRWSTYDVAIDVKFRISRRHQITKTLAMMSTNFQSYVVSPLYSRDTTTTPRPSTMKVSWPQNHCHNCPNWFNAIVPPLRKSCIAVSWGRFVGVFQEINCGLSCRIIYYSGQIRGRQRIC